MEAEGYSEALVTVNHTTSHHFLEDILQMWCHFAIDFLMLILSQNLDTGMQEIILTGLYT
jgi:hypothetical protein